MKAKFIYLLSLLFILIYSFEIKAQYALSIPNLIELPEPDFKIDPSFDSWFLNPPIFMEESHQILFNWQIGRPIINGDLEFRLYAYPARLQQPRTILKDTPVFRQLITGPSLVLNYEELLLNEGMKYVCVLVPVLHGKPMPEMVKAETFQYFTFIPDCTPPQYVVSKIQDGNKLEVSWEGSGLQLDVVQYELSYRSISSYGVLSSWKDPVVTSRVSYVLENFEPGFTYEVKVRKRCKKVKDDEDLESDWTYAPPVQLPYLNRGYQDSLCNLLNGAYLAGSATGIVVSWNGPSASLPEINYRILYRNISLNETHWSSLIVVQGNSFDIPNLIAGDVYEIELQMIVASPQGGADYDCSPINLGTSEAGTANDGGGSLEDPEENPEIELPPFNCGDGYDIPNVDQSTHLSSADTGQIFYIGGFPVLLKEIDGGNGFFDGRGIIPLPFNGKTVAVAFTGVEVNANKEIFNGTVNAIADSPANYPNFLPDPINTESPICQDPPNEEGFNEEGIWVPTGLPYNPQGFNINGEYVVEPPYPGYQSGDPYDPNYDPNGYDAEGIHVETGTIYNPEGCSQAGLDANGQPCDPNGDGPYDWLDGGNNDGDPPTGEGIEFSHQVNALIRPKIIEALNTLLVEAQDSISETRNRCNTTREAMNTLVQNLGYERPFIFGPDDEYFEEGMHLQFSQEPKPLEIFLDRNPEEEQLEKKHVDLFHCDKKLYLFLDWEKLIENQLLEAALSDFEKDLIEKVRRFSAEEVAQYNSDMNAFDDWIFLQTDQHISILLGEVYGSVDVNPLGKKIEKTPLFYDRNPVFNSEINNWLASIDEDIQTEILAGSFSKNREDWLQDASFEFLQGWTYIGGIHRAYFLEAIAKERKFSASLSNANAHLLPVEISKQVAGRNYTIYLDQIVFTPQGAFLDAYFILELPNSGDRLVFQLTDVEFGPTGTHKSQGNKLLLLTEVQARLSNAAQLNILPGEDTYVAWDCEGFAGMSVAAEIEFCRKYLLPVNPANLEIIPDETVRVKAHFTAAMPAWGEFIADLSIDPFALPQLTDVKWEVNGAKIDMSNSENPQGLIFPDNYCSPFVVNGQASHLWKGFYLNALTVTLPNQFNDTNGNLTAGVENVIIDDMGFTGKAFVSSLLDLSQGNLSGWAFSVDTFALSVRANQLTGANFSGLVHLPILSSNTNQGNTIGPKDCLAYRGLIEAGNNYSFDVEALGDYRADIWRAQISIESGSGIQIFNNGDSFTAKASLNGRLHIDGDFGGGKNIQVPDVAFQNLVLSNKAPYFEPGIWGFPGEIGANFAGFGLKLGGLRLEKANGIDDDIALKFNAELRLGSDDNGDAEGNYLVAAGGMEVVGELVEINGRQRWQYKDFVINSFGVEGSFPGIDYIRGSLQFYEDHPTFGKGFRGLVGVEFGGLKKVRLDALAQFGKIEDYKYFLVDAMATLDPGIDLGGLQLLGFGGGAYRHMSRTASPPLSSQTSGPVLLPPLGNSLSGVNYTPDKTLGLGLKATIAMAVSGKKEAFNFNATLGAEFNSGGGFRSIYFQGNGRFMSPVDMTANPVFDNVEANPNNGALVSASVGIEYDFNNKVLDGNFAVYVNTPGSIITGVGDNGRMGQVILHFAPNKWYVNIGTPTDRCGLKLSPLGIDLLKLQTYMDIGNDIPPMPPLPAQVQSLLGMGNFGASPGLRASGSGFAFGADLTFDTGNLNFLIFYARLQAGLGFDLMLMDYGNTLCTNTNETIGLGGWYASGQAWAYVQGDIGIRTRLFGQEKTFNILSLGAAVALQAKLPNPFWAKGNVGGYYNIMGGLIKGKCNFQIEIGEVCDFEGGSAPEIDVPIIQDLTPFDDSKSISTFFKPTATFYMPLNETFALNDKNHKLQLAYAKLTTADGYEIPGEVEFSEDQTYMEFKPYVALPFKQSLTFEVKVDVLLNGTVVDSDTKTSSFETDWLNYFIPEDNVLASYPLNGQYNFYQQEKQDHRGYILLDVGQAYLFSNIPQNYKMQMRIYDSYHQSEFSTNDVKYDVARREISFPLPADLPNNEVYRLELGIYFNPPGQLSDGDGNTNPGEQPRPLLGFSNDPEDGEGSDPVIINTGNLGEIGDKKIYYTVYFRTSQYNTFREKIQAFEQQQQTSFSESSHCLIAQTTQELFDYYEVGSGGKVNALVTMKSNPLQTGWFNNFPKNEIYAYLPSTAFNFNFRNREADFPIENTVEFHLGANQERVEVLPDDHGSTGLQRYAAATQKIKYWLPALVRTDKSDLNSQVRVYIEKQLSEFEGDLAKQEQAFGFLPQFMKDIYNDESHLPTPGNGQYPIEVSYRLPGKDQVTSSFRINLVK